MRRIWWLAALTLLIAGCGMLPPPKGGGQFLGADCELTKWEIQNYPHTTHKVVGTVTLRCPTTPRIFTMWVRLQWRPYHIPLGHQHQPVVPWVPAGPDLLIKEPPPADGQDYEIAVPCSLMGDGRYRIEFGVQGVTSAGSPDGRGPVESREVRIRCDRQVYPGGPV